MMKTIAKVVNKGKALQTGILFFLMFAILITGCASKEEVNDEDMFSFDIPSGFSRSDMSDKECAIINSEGVAVGGFIITDLDVKDIKDKDGIALPQYLNKVHEGCEYFSWMVNDSKKPAQYVSQYVNMENTTEAKEYYRVFFEKNSYVYDMWFDTDMIDENSIAEFVSTIVEQ